MLPRFSSVAVRERYNKIVAAKNIWEEQRFFFDDNVENYGLEPIIYKRLNDLALAFRHSLTSLKTKTLTQSRIICASKAPSGMSRARTQRPSGTHTSSPRLNCGTPS
ncbi:hypothetical protein GQ457_05G030280 [Hibiscus cannabinus]